MKNQLRRTYHILEGSPGNLGSLLHGNFHQARSRGTYISEALQLSDNPSVQHFLQHTDSAGNNWDNWTGRDDESDSSTASSSSQDNIVPDSAQQSYATNNADESSGFATSSDTSSDGGTASSKEEPNGDEVEIAW